jgi:hypothetical protein
MKTTLFLITTLAILSFTEGTKYVSSTYGYSLEIPNGWAKKDRSVALNVDLKLIDGKGNSLIIVVQKTNNANKSMTAFESLSSVSNTAFENSIAAMHPNPRVVKRGKVNYNNYEYAYIHFTTKGEGEPMLYHKCFMTLFNSNMYTITATTYYNTQTETAVYFERILQTLRLN